MIRIAPDNTKLGGKMHTKFPLVDPHLFELTCRSISIHCAAAAMALKKGNKPGK